MEKQLQNIFAGVVTTRATVTISEVIKEIGWGSNRDIRQTGFRVDSGFNAFKSPFFSQRVKEMPIIKDPKALISSGSAVLTKNGRHVMVIELKREQACQQSSKEDASSATNIIETLKTIVITGRQMIASHWSCVKKTLTSLDK